MSKYRVSVKEIGTNEVVRDLGAHNERKADRIEHGLLRQMDMDKFYVDIEKEGEKK